MEARKLTFMKTNIFIIILFLFQSVFCFSQNKPAPKNNRAVSADCKKPIPIELKSSYTYGPTVPPKGFGDHQEFKLNNNITFEGEHNSAWYLLSISKDGELIFDIVPQDTTNDYDFLIYTYTDSAFCDALQKNKLKPLRSNLSNIKKSVEGNTGIKTNATANPIGKGIGKAYSKSIDVKKGEKYMLILDNVTPEGKGHTIFFNFIKEVEIKGKVLGSDSIPLVAEITLSDNKGNTVEETKSNSYGEYKINTKINENQNYSLTYFADSTFVQSTTINTKDLKGKAEFPNIKTVLPKLKKGEKYKLGSINFYGNVAILLPESYPSVEALYKLMKKNKNMKINIEGHVNDPVKKASISIDSFNQILSDNRAKAIYDFLILKGIDKERMRTEGFSNKKMLFPHPLSETEEQANRRVEIKVVSINGE